MLTTPPRKYRYLCPPPSLLSRTTADPEDFFVKPSHLFSSYSLFLLLEQTMVFFPLCYISTTLGSFPSSQQSFHTLFGLPTFTIEPWSPLLFSLSIEKCFLHWLGSVQQKRHKYVKRRVRITCNLFSRLSQSICKHT